MGATVRCAEQPPSCTLIPGGKMPQSVDERLHREGQTRFELRITLKTQVFQF